MTEKAHRLVWFGNERIATGVTTANPILRQLLDDGYDIAAIVVNENRLESTTPARSLEITTIAREHNIPLLIPKKLTDIQDQLRSYQADAAVLVAYGKIIPQKIIDIFPAGIINVHPSLLPKHRGPTPIESAILSADEETGISIMQLVKEMDAGPVFAYTTLRLDGTESKQSLSNELGELAATMLHEVLPSILDGGIIAVPQDASQATYDQLVTKSRGILDWQKPAEVLEREIRAFAEWPKSRANLEGIDMIITQAHPAPSATPQKPGYVEIAANKDMLMIHTVDGCLCIDKLKPAGKNEMTTAEFLRGYGARLKS